MRTIRIVMMLGFSVAMPLAAAGQAVATTYGELRTLIRPGDTLTVTDTSGLQVSGKVTELSASSLALMVDGRPREWREADVATITERRADSLVNGTLIGLGVGALTGSVLLWAMGRDSDVPTSAGMLLLGGAAAGAIGAAIGARADAVQTTQQVVFRRQPASGVSVMIAPLVGPAGAVARVSVRF